MSSNIVLPIVSVIAIGLVVALPAPGSVDLIAVCKGDGNYPITKMTDVFGRVKYLNQNNERIDIPSWCDLEEDKNGNITLVPSAESVSGGGL